MWRPFYRPAGSCVSRGEHRPDRGSRMSCRGTAVRSTVLRHWRHNHRRSSPHRLRAGQGVKRYRCDCRQAVFVGRKDQRVGICAVGRNRLGGQSRGRCGLRDGGPRWMWKPPDRLPTSIVRPIVIGGSLDSPVPIRVSVSSRPVAPPVHYGGLEPKSSNGLYLHNAASSVHSSGRSESVRLRPRKHSLPNTSKSELRLLGSDSSSSN